MKSPSIFVSLLLLSPMSAPALLAQDADELETIVVTGTRLPTPIENIGQSVTVITAEDIQARQQVQLFDALSLVPGLQSTRSGPIGTVSTVFLRGAPSNQTLVVQDGIVLNSLAATSGGFNFANFDTSDIDRIEVIRGAQSTIYGSDAIGGVVNIITKSGREGFGASAMAEAGSFGTIRGNSSVYGGNETLHGRFTVSAQSVNGFSAQASNDENDSFENLTLSGRVVFQPSESFKIEALARYSDTTAEFDGFPSIFAESDTEEWNIAAFATHTALEGRLTNRIGVTYSALDSENVQDQSGDEIPDSVTFRQFGERLSFEYQGYYDANDWLDLVWGAEHEEASADVPVAFISFAEEIEQTSVYGLARISPTDWIDLTAGIRHDGTSQFEDATTANASANFRSEDTGTILRASYTEGFRAPSPGQLGANANNLQAIIDNGIDPAIDPERSTGFDIGIEQNLFVADASLTVTYFNIDIEDLIAFQFVGSSFAPAFFNINAAETEGVEVALQARPVSWINVMGSYTYTDAINAETGIQLDNRPKHRATLDVQVDATENFSFGVQAIHNGSELESFGAPLAEFTIVNFRAEYTFDNGFSVFGRVDNVTDNQYFDNGGFNTAPLSAYAGVRARF